MARRQAKKVTEKTRKTPEKAVVIVDWKVTFLEALRDKPNVTKACDAAGIARATAYHHRELFPEFAAAWNKALRQGVCSLEDAAFDRAFSGSDTLMIFLLKAHFPDRYRDRQEITIAQSDLTKLTDDELAAIAAGKAAK